MKEYHTPDLSLAAFLLMKGIKLISAEKTLSGKFSSSFPEITSLDALIIATAILREGVPSPAEVGIVAE